ncbi:MAG TPA: hypothetical protein VJ044_08015, partial [Candidatus Hodarchaeales archaeon]|nr:hypothetical protein [Candidatus Hodarchaeales archaeon]
ILPILIIDKPLGRFKKNRHTVPNNIDVLEAISAPCGAKILLEVLYQRTFRKILGDLGDDLYPPHSQRRPS